MDSVTAHYLAQTTAGQLPGRELAWLQAQRERNSDEFARRGFPNLRDEDWRYTPLRAITAHQFTTQSQPTLPSEAELETFAIPDLPAPRMVFIDGIFAPSLSRLPEQNGLKIGSLAEVLEREPDAVAAHLGATLPERRHGFTALNHASSRDGVVLRVAKNTALEVPLELLFVSAGENALAQPRNLIVLDDAASARVITRQLSLNPHPTFTNASTEIVVGANAELDYYLLQQQATTAHAVHSIWARQSRDSRLRSHTITLGGGLVRNDLRVELNGQGAHCDMLGLYTARARQHLDNHTTVVHQAAHCTSREIYKGVLAERARGVFHGRIVVRPGAQKTDATQRNANLLLSGDAEINTKPQLEIYADDVKCAHGATVGQIDPDALFYLRSRGLDAARARALLTFGFVNDMLEKVAIPELAQRLSADLERAFAH